MPELSTIGLVQLPADTQSMDPSSHTVSTNVSTTAATAPATTTEATLTVSAQLTAPSSSVPTDAQQAVDDAVDEIDSDSPQDFILTSHKAGSSVPDPSPH